MIELWQKVAWIYESARRGYMGIADRRRAEELLRVSRCLR